MRGGAGCGVVVRKNVEIIPAYCTGNRRNLPSILTNKSINFLESFRVHKNPLYLCAISKKITAMTQLIINVENKALLPSLRNILSAIEGVSIERTTTHKRKCRLDKALEEAAKGKTKSFNSVKELMEDLEE
jgi:hypothetical protein